MKNIDDKNFEDNDIGFNEIPDNILAFGKGEPSSLDSNFEMADADFAPYPSPSREPDDGFSFEAIAPSSWTLPSEEFDDMLEAASYFDGITDEPAKAGAEGEFEPRFSDGFKNVGNESADAEKEVEPFSSDGAKSFVSESADVDAENIFETDKADYKTEHMDFNVPPDTGIHKKRVVFIIGASDGIGEKTAELLVQKGCVVYNGSRTPCGIVEVKNIVLDVVNGDYIDSAVAQILAAEQKIDALVYSAGFSMTAPLEYAEEEDYRYLFDVNFFGFVRAAKAVIPNMRENGGGRIIAVGSMGGVLPIAFDSFYSASKTAMNMLIKSMALELEPFGIKATSVMPGGTATGFTRKRKVYPPEKTGVYEKQLMKANTALGAMEQNGMLPEKVAETIAALIDAPAPALTCPVGLKNKVIMAADKILPDNVSNMIIKNRYRV
ncbi:MAG: SDR family NAD(P)-dependent oxidoreductase [Clostridiales bacterium]|jgi:short-subunit dehydrogenase|nr:SDR family NAD(P)-dependent oxidoreductase [Clostridiales bacterium]